MNKKTGLQEPTFILVSDYILIEEILKYKKVTKQEVNNMQFIIRKYIDSKCTICPSCAAQIKFAHKRITNWWDKVGNELRVKNHKGNFIKKQNAEKYI